MIQTNSKIYEKNGLQMFSCFLTFNNALWLFSISQLRTLETNHHEKLSDIAVVTLEKLMKNELEEEISEDVRVVSENTYKEV